MMYNLMSDYLCFLQISGGHHIGDDAQSDGCSTNFVEAVSSLREFHCQE